MPKSKISRETLVPLGVAISTAISLGSWVISIEKRLTISSANADSYDERHREEIKRIEAFEQLVRNIDNRLARIEGELKRIKPENER